MFEAKQPMAAWRSCSPLRGYVLQGYVGRNALGVRPSFGPTARVAGHLSAGFICSARIAHSFSSSMGLNPEGLS